MIALSISGRLEQISSKYAKAFEDVKSDLVHAAMLHHPAPESTLNEWTLHTNASESSVGAVLHQLVGNEFQPLGYSTYDRELTAIFQSIKFFLHFLEGLRFIIFTDHKPITFEFQQSLEKASPRQLRQLNFIAEFSTDIHHSIADWLSRIAFISTDKIDFNKLSLEQKLDQDLLKIIEFPDTSSLKIKLLPMEGSDDHLYCDTSTNSIRPWVPMNFRQQIFNRFHNISHPGRKSTVKLIKDRYVWPRMEKDIKKFVKFCIECRKCKVQRHNKSSSSFYDAPEVGLNISILI